MTTVEQATTIPPAPDPAAIYAQNVADEDGLRHPSTLRALALTVVQLATYHGSDHAALGLAVQQAITAHREDDQPPQVTS